MVLQLPIARRAGQARPPGRWGAMTLRNRMCTPLPHSSEQIDQLDQFVTMQLICAGVGLGVGLNVGHTDVLHTRS